MVVYIYRQYDVLLGEGQPPMFGDFEAQRHWMEITYQLKPNEWYVNSSNNDLQYWGLDYPPLTAYHSYIMGAISHRFNSSWVELFTSRGLHDSVHRLFMRYTVMVADVVVYLPAVFVYFLLCTPSISGNSKLYWALLALIYPGLILIDHGHFQYNNISLGLTLWAVIGLEKGHDLLGSIAFVLALNYKQMELYHSVPFFSYLLGKCIFGTENLLLKLIKIGLVVLTTFALCWLPFIWSQDVFLQVVNRLFPFARGLYEDKVANVWCSISLVLKLRNIFDHATLIKVCLFSTLLALLPSSLHLLMRPTVRQFKYALVNCSLVFFLFSFQVHEKSILIPALAVCLLLPEHPFSCRWFLQTSTFSMLPLLIKDGLFLPYCALMPMFHVMTDLVCTNQPENSKTSMNTSMLVKVLFWLSNLGIAVLSMCSVALDPPSHLPDLFPVLVSAYSCGHFVMFLVYFHLLQWTSSKGEQKSQNIPKIGFNTIRERKFKKTKKIN